jgi:hypothetical protein
MDKHYSLMGPFVSYEENEVVNVAPVVNGPNKLECRITVGGKDLLEQIL